MEELHRIELCPPFLESVLHLCVDGRVSEQPITWRCRLVIPLGHFTPISCLVEQLERGLEVVHVQAHPSIEVSQGLTGDAPAVTFVSDKPADDSAVLLFDPSLVILSVSSRTRKLELPALTVVHECFIDKCAVVVGVDSYHRHR